VKTYVQRAIKRSTESKILVTSSFVNGIVQTAINPGYTVNLAPQMVQGTGEGQRIGNKINIISVRLKGYLTLYPSSNPYPPAYASQFNCRLFIGNVKATPTATPASGDFVNLLRSGTGATGFGTDLMSLMRPVHKDYWTIRRDRKYKIGVSSGTSLSVSGGNPNNDYSLVRFINLDLTKNFKKLLRYDDNDQAPQNFGLYMFMGCVDVFGSPSAPANPVCQFTYEIEYVYDDA